tara:strand:+ start:58 stop:378 length:321 start_codon:yes stop_codon:yes gene_type:complete
MCGRDAVTAIIQKAWITNFQAVIPAPVVTNATVSGLRPAKDSVRLSTPYLVQLLLFRNPLHRVTIDELRNESEPLLVGHPENWDQVDNDQHYVLSYLGQGDSPYST